MKKVAETGVEMTRAQVAASAAGRKRKIECCQGELSYSTSFLQLRRSRRLRVAVTPEENSTENAADSNSNDRCASCCSSKGSSDQVENDNSKFVDLEMEEEEEESAEIVTSTYESENCRERRETTPSSEVQAESGEMESTAVRPSSSSSEENSSRRRRSRDDKMPSKDELEEFFSAAEKKLQEQFAQKYNFDIVKEEPLEGRYEWVRVKP